ncbi:MAG: hypothetical protein R3324_09080, partial [Halobacteriales archaeon]|nr:hypothetical protein [Halobacteriales archaeon]
RVGGVVVGGVRVAAVIRSGSLVRFAMVPVFGRASLIGIWRHTVRRFVTCGFVHGRVSGDRLAPRGADRRTPFELADPTARHRMAVRVRRCRFRSGTLRTFVRHEVGWG